MTSFWGVFDTCGGWTWRISWGLLGSCSCTSWECRWDEEEAGWLSSAGCDILKNNGFKNLRILWIRQRT